MTKINVKHILIFCIFARETSTQNQSCQSVHDGLNNITWVGTINGNTVSNPICVGSNHEVLYRECTNGEWGPEPQCSTIQEPIMEKCPEGYTNLSRLCYYFTQPTSFPPNCPPGDTVPFESYRYLIADRKFWVPAKRDFSNGLGFMQWVEASSCYRDDVTNYLINENDTDGDCIISDESGQMVAVSCTNNYPGVCVFKAVANWLQNPACGDHCVPRDFFNFQECTCVANATKIQYPRAEFLTPSQNLAIKNLTIETCTMGLQKLPNGTYIWKTSNTEILYTFWSDKVTFGDGYIYGAANSDGWSLTKTPLSCTFYNKKLYNNEPNLELTFNDTEKIFILKITNFQMLKMIDGIPVLCFTDIDSKSLIFRYPTSYTFSDRASVRIFTFPFVALNYHPGHFWCEGFRLNDAKVIKSNVILLHVDDNYSEFVLILRVAYALEAGVDPLSKAMIDYLDNKFLALFKSSDEFNGFYNARIMKILEIDRKLKEIVVNFHLSALTVSVDDFYNYNQIYPLIQDFVSRLKGIEIVKFVSANFCHEGNNGSLYWPRAHLGETVISEEFCFTVNGTRSQRTCLGSFMDGAQWSDYEPCEVFSKSSFTNRLLALNKLSLKNQTSTLYEISLKADRLKALDIQLILANYERLLGNGTALVESLAKTINNLLRFCDKSVLGKAQTVLGATDGFLKILEDISVKSPKKFDFGFDFFIFKSFCLTDFSGVLIFDNGTVRVTNKDLSTVTKIHGLKMALVLPLEEKMSTQRMTFSIFFNSNFFIEKEPNFFNTTPIFGVVLPKGTTEPVKIVYKVEFDESSDFCLSWNYSATPRGSWRELGHSEINKHFAECEFNSSGYFALSSEPKEFTNVTETLKSILHSNETSTTIVRVLTYVSKKYEAFKAIDVRYVAEILKKIRSNNNTNLQHLGATVSNLLKIDKQVLAESQFQAQSTDLILSNIDQILLNHQKEPFVLVPNENFTILLVDLEKMDFDGVAVIDDGRNFYVVVLNKSFSFSDVVEHPFFDSAVLINPELKAQIVNNSKIIITVFQRDEFFNPKKSTKGEVKTIFGVVFPGIRNYSAPVSVLYKIFGNSNRLQCSFWFYDNSTFGYWQNDSSPKANSSNLIQCDFWHTTHFALLVLDSQFLHLTAYDTLDLITTINATLSLIGLLIIILTAICFRNWRTNTGNQILLNFVVILILEIAVFFVSSTITGHRKHYTLCIATGVVLHYCTISQFCWMLSVAVLQFRRFVDVLRAPPANVLVKCCVCGWVLPLVPVIILIVVDRDSYLNRDFALCYPSKWGLYLGVWLPVSVIIIINTIIFLVIVYHIIFRKVEFVEVNKVEIFYQLRLALLLFFMFGLTWIFGFLSNFHDSDILQYLFSCTATLQGFVVFLYFIVFNPNTKYLYLKSMRKCLSRNSKD